MTTIANNRKNYDVSPTFRLYSVLGVTRYSTEEEIKKAYRREALKYHPDKLGTVPDEATRNLIADINLAYEILSHPEKRDLYFTYGDYSLTDLDLGNVKSNNGLEIRERLRHVYTNILRAVGVIIVVWVAYKFF